MAFKFNARVRRASWLAHSRLIACLIALLATGPARAASPEAPQEVRLQFAWPDGLHARVAQTKSVTRGSGGAPETTSGKSSYELRAAKSADGMLVHFGDIEVQRAEHGRGKVDQALVNQIARVPQPSYRISKEGAFVGLGDLTAFRRAMGEVLRQEAPPDVPPERLKKAFDVATSEEMLSGFAANDWNNLVGFWIGGVRLAVGETYELTQQNQPPMLEGRSVRLLVRFKILEVLPCERPGVKTTCIDVEVRSMPDPVDFARVIEEMMRKFQDKPDSARALVSKAFMETYLKLRTEPDTLVPHAYHLRKEMVTAAGEGAKAQTATNVQDTEVRFEYLAADR